jgi:hypothetical protein
MEMNGVNYLIPVDARLETDRDLQFEALPLDQLLSVPNAPDRCARPDAVSLALSPTVAPLCVSKTPYGLIWWQKRLTSSTMVALLVRLLPDALRLAVQVEEPT